MNMQLYHVYRHNYISFLCFSAVLTTSNRPAILILYYQYDVLSRRAGIFLWNVKCLTEAGVAYIEHIESIRRLETELELQIQDIKELETGKIIIGGSHYLNAFILPKILSGFTSMYPKISIDLVEASSAQLSEMLRKQEIDMTFHCSPEFIQDFERYPAFFDRVLLAVPKSIDPLSADPEVSGKALTAEEVVEGRHLEQDCPMVPLMRFRSLAFVLLSEGNNLYERSVRMFKEAGFSPVTKMQLSQLVTAYHLANAGIGATFVSDRLVSTHMDALNYYKLDSTITTRQFYILLPRRKYVSAAARRFIDFFPTL